MQWQSVEEEKAKGSRWIDYVSIPNVHIYTHTHVCLRIIHSLPWYLCCIVSTSFSLAFLFYDFESLALC